MPVPVSVIIPTYNRADAVRQAVGSVLAQTCSDFELIVVDDGSEERIDPAALWHPAETRCRCVRLAANSGVALARNAGASLASGKWLAFLDSDDTWHRDKLKRQLAWMRAHPLSRIAQTREIWIRRGKRVNPPATHVKKPGDIFAESLQRCMITSSSVIMEKTLFDETGGFNESLRACEDYDLWLRIACRYQVGLVDAYLLTRYGGHPDQLSASVDRLDRFRVRALLDLLARSPLSEQQRSLARETLIRKARILAAGSHKRGKVEEYEHYTEIARRFGG
ncbi:MAG: glycosyltransferase [Chitinivibrionales bacterium]|nr:glycosyltransferase [Chitinivibrionales bacterium]MBD3396264.1 glycosyltransferase [Chitinivibrionales bacterium]